MAKNGQRERNPWLKKRLQRSADIIQASKEKKKKGRLQVLFSFGLISFFSFFFFRLPVENVVVLFKPYKLIGFEIFD